MSEERRAFRALVGLSARRLGRRAFSRVGRILAGFIALVCIGSIVALRVDEGPNASTTSIPLLAARWSVWLAAGPLLLAAAHHRKLTDRKDGIEALALTRGFTSRALGLSRAAATVRSTWLYIAVPALAASIASLLVAGSWAAVRDRALLLGVIGVYASVTALVLGPLAAIADVLSVNRGRTMFLAVLFLPWAVADALGNPSLSVPGALGALLRFGLEIAGLKRLL
jgi:hypothetical protein